MDARLKKRVIEQQRSEITEYHLYMKLAKRVKHAHNRKTLRDIAKEEKKHYEFWHGYTGVDVQPSYFRIWLFYLLSLLFGLTFGVKLMERGESRAQKFYKDISKHFPDAARLQEEEEEHEQEIVKLLEEEKLKYVGSMVLGLNDALVELTGALAGLTLALQNTNLIAVTGLITGIAASMSMAASEYLSTKAEEVDKRPVRAAVYTGFAYILTVLILIAPFFLVSNVFFALGLTVMFAVAIIAFFNFYVSVAQDVPFRKRFVEMLVLSLGIALISFVVGWLVRIFLHVEV